MRNDSDTLRRIFTPGRNIDLVFDLDTPSQKVRTASIYEHNQTANKMIISQTHPPILPSMKYKTLQLTMLIDRDEVNILRIGLNCQIAGFKNDYQLSKNVIEKAIVIEYAPPPKEINVRATYRLRPNPKYSVDGIINYRGNKFISTEAFKIFDLSLSGVGLVVPNVVNKKSNGLIKVNVGDNAKIDLRLIDTLEETTGGSFATFVEVVRKNTRYSQNNAFVGLKFCGLNRDYEPTLGRFIHEAQLYDIKRI